MKPFLIFVLSLMLGTAFGQNSRDLYPDVLKLGYHVDDPLKIDANVFSDSGAWHAYTLPAVQADYGSFIGPLVMDMEGKWLAGTLAKLTVTVAGRKLELGKGKVALHYYPGLLEQEILIEGLKIQLQMIFVSDRTALVHTLVTNQTAYDQYIQLSWSGSCLLKDVQLKQNSHGIRVNFDQGHIFQIDFQGRERLSYQLKPGGYAAITASKVLRPHEVREYTRRESYYLQSSEMSSTTGDINFKQALQANKMRWDQYLNNYFTAPGTEITDSVRRRLAVKSILTLMTNWRSKAKDLLHGGVFPSLNYQGFYGFWSWDSWKQVVGLSYFFPSLAKENMLAMFDYQDKYGMIADCIYTDQKENNWRDTKPPLAAWAVWEIYKRTADKEFLKTIYPKLIRYHQWWYENRDHNQNGLCEYGSSDGTRTAALWESGMDNAVRFDKAVMLKNNESAWSLNQESVDLNAYLYAEKDYLSEIAAAIGLDQEAEKWKVQLPALKKLINNTFYNPGKGFYYDRLLDGRWVEVTGPEGWIPLWSRISSQEQATAVLGMMEKKNKFNTLVPLPTLSADHPDFDPLKGYWRGPVWIDQVYFGLNGLHLYGYHQQASALLTQLLKNADGLSGQGAIRENYHPITGKGLNAINFSWSAAHLLLMLKEDIKL